MLTNVQIPFLETPLVPFNTFSLAPVRQAAVEGRRLQGHHQGVVRRPAGCRRDGRNAAASGKKYVRESSLYPSFPPSLPPSLSPSLQQTMRTAENQDPDKKRANDD